MFFKVGREPLSLTWAGSEFQTVGAATEKTRLPSLVRVLGLGAVRESTDRDECEDFTVTYSQLL